ncbi:glycosyltransferase involved in cell wall biosynthesis [Micromonospora pisi]|uniref:Glycosyltransferase involved in cell wall biosynthesis n=1 Tax=Micromonospora pisi TaxID=589240 RepID=A0A495JSJ0_9ACTN|nr:glycosyltransferase [Micromonospora pisi]RKR91332.1 glycosyltransferase involved in cell wall biosynthesis [Micromonospora pisi]
MRVVVTTETRFSRAPDGSVWTQDGPAYPFFSRYLAAFDTVRVVARLRHVDTPAGNAHRVDGPGVELWPLPHYVGPRQYLASWRSIRQAVRAAAQPGDAVILRVPSPTGAMLAGWRERQRLPYAIEVVGDPYDVFAPGVVEHPLRPFLRQWGTTRLRHLCRSAGAVAYVTERHLQSRYPSRPDALSVAYSSVDLPAEAFVPAPRRVDRAPRPGTLISIGSLDQLYKGIDTLIEALARIAADGEAPRLVHLGDGRFRPQLERLVVEAGLADRVTFVGTVPAGPAVRKHLDAADLVVVPSRTEGLPRVLIEAMARGLPALGSNVGGIPELLGAEDMVPPNDPFVLAAAIRHFLADPARLTAASARNLARAQDYSVASLRPRRDDFYRTVRDTATRRVPAGRRA